MVTSASSWALIMSPGLDLVVRLRETSEMNQAGVNQSLRALPAVDTVLKSLDSSGAPAAQAARRAIDEARSAVRAGGTVPTLDEIVGAARRLIRDEERFRLGPVINATGVLVHTNLGRVPLGAAQLEAVADVASGYSNLEFDLGSGKRGSRYEHARELINTLVGSEASLVVNNNAAAVMLVLAALCAGREVIISRGELVEIGGEFRIPDVMESAGVRLVEVGTTNRTHISDYEKAISPDTAAILKVHPSNYKVIGFTKDVPARELARLARGRGVSFLHDLGSGLIDHAVDITEGETPVAQALKDGANIVTFSGDKLLGGPQAGIIAGDAPLLDVIERHPYLRALRVDKMTLAALQATLLAYLEGRQSDIPLWAMLGRSLEDLESRARAIASRLSDPPDDLKVEVVLTEGLTGGGSLPEETIPSYGISISGGQRSAAEIERVLRRADPPVIARVEDDRVLLDMRTVLPHQDEPLGAILEDLL